MITTQRQAAIAVQKYGGSSLSTVDQLHRVARRVAAGHRSGQPTVVVVSARGDTTDDLLRLAGRAGTGSARELDQLLATGECAAAALLAIAVQDLGVPAVSLTGGQAGIRVAGRAGAGVIADVDPGRVRAVLADGAVAVVAGFQGLADDGDVVTLGRGGSDTTAVALAAALAAPACEICTDVPGVATADPRVVRTARVLPSIDAGLMAEMSFAGAKVLHSRAVELAAMHRVALHVRDSAAATAVADAAPAGRTVRPGRGEQGTVVRPGQPGSEGSMLETRGVVVAIAHDLDVARVLVQSASHRRDLAAEILGVLAAHAVPVDLVARSGPYEDEFRMGFTVRRHDAGDALNTVRDTLAGLGATLTVDENVGKVSLIGMGLLNRPQYTARMLAALSAAEIPTSWLSTSQLRTSVVIPLDHVQSAVRLLHDEFGLDRDRLGPVSATPA